MDWSEWVRREAAARGASSLRVTSALWRSAAAATAGYTKPNTDAPNVPEGDERVDAARRVRPLAVLDDSLRHIDQALHRLSGEGKPCFELGDFDRRAVRHDVSFQRSVRQRLHFYEEKFNARVHPGDDALRVVRLDGACRNDCVLEGRACPIEEERRG